MNTSLKPGLLDRTITLRQIVRTLVIALIIAVCIYIPALLFDSWTKAKTNGGGLGAFSSPYREIIPKECRIAVDAASTNFGMSDSQKAIDSFLMRPIAWAYSLSESEKKLGFGMKGLPCMGYQFLIVLHSPGYKRVNRYVNDNGELVATVTVEVFKAYRPPTSPEVQQKTPRWERSDKQRSESIFLESYPNRSVK